MAIEPVPELPENGEQEEKTKERPSDSSEALKGTGFSPYMDVPQQSGALAPEGVATSIPRTVLEARLEAALSELSMPSSAPNTPTRLGHLALLKRWYYRPEAKRTGEIFFPDADDHWPIRAILRGIGRVAAKSLGHAQID